MTAACGTPIPPPAFAEPWHAHLFALTLGLQDAGLFTAPDWAQHFGARLKRQGAVQPIEGGDDYYAVWLEALESLLSGQGIAPAADLAALKQAWEQAYLATPHGAPVRLSQG